MPAIPNMEQSCYENAVLQSIQQQNSFKPPKVEELLKHFFE
jgi:hypothetical protein